MAFSTKTRQAAVLLILVGACQSPPQASTEPRPESTVPTVSDEKSSGAAPPLAQAGPDRPLEVAWGYYGRLIAGDIDGALGYLARFPGVDEAALRKKFTAESEDLRRGYDDFHIEEARIDGDIAVTVYVQTQETIKPVFFVAPIYLIRQENRWKILPAFNRFDAPEYDLSESHLKRFRQLSQWFAVRKEELRAAHRKKLRESDL